MDKVQVFCLDAFSKSCPYACLDINSHPDSPKWKRHCRRCRPTINTNSYLGNLCTSLYNKPLCLIQKPSNIIVCNLISLPAFPQNEYPRYGHGFSQKDFFRIKSLKKNDEACKTECTLNQWFFSMLSFPIEKKMFVVLLQSREKDRRWQ